MSNALSFVPSRRLTHDQLARIRVALRLGEYVDAAVIELLLEEIDALDGVIHFLHMTAPLPIDLT